MWSRILNRIENGADAVEGDVHFADGVILHITMNNPEHNPTPTEDKWLKEMREFLSTGLPPPRMQTEARTSVWWRRPYTTRGVTAYGEDASIVMRRK